MPVQEENLCTEGPSWEAICLLLRLGHLSVVLLSVSVVQTQRTVSEPAGCTFSSGLMKAEPRKSHEGGLEVSHPWPFF